MTKHVTLYQSLDMYRKVPADFLESTKRGSFLSIIALLTTATLIYKETRSFFVTTLVTDLALDLENQDPKLRINFNITMMDLKCDFVNLDSVSIFGHEQNVQSNILKRGIDAEGVKQQFLAQNRKQEDIHMFNPSITESFIFCSARRILILGIWRPRRLKMPWKTTNLYLWIIMQGEKYTSVAEHFMYMLINRLILFSQYSVLTKNLTFIVRPIC